MAVMAAPETTDIAAFADFCGCLVLENGEPFELEPFQWRMLEDYFAGTTETLILIPKKNGKSTLLGALALHHLLTVSDPECVVGAASRDQAKILYNQAAGLVRRSPKLKAHLPEGKELRVQRGYGEIKLIKEGDAKEQWGRIRVLAADADTADGVIPTLALVDELHRHRSADLYGVFRDGLGPRGGKMLTISTAGDLEDSPLGQMRAAAYQLPTVERDGVYRYCRSEDGLYVMHEWALEADQDRDDLELVLEANPASWQTTEQLRRRHDSPSMTPWQWARFACGVWTAGEDSWLPPEAWDACAEPDCEIPDGATVTLGVDIGLKHDKTALVALHRREDGRFVVKAEVFDPPGGGDALDLAGVEARIRELAARWHVEAVVYDPWSFERSAQMLADEGLLMVEHPPSHERMHKASVLIYEGVMNKRIVHDGDPVLAAHVAAAAAKDTDRGWKIVKNPKIKRPIDALMAMCLGYSVASERPAAVGFEW